MLIYLGAIAILFVFGVMLVNNNKRETIKAEKATIPFLVTIIMLIFLIAVETTLSVSEIIYGLNPNCSSELLSVGCTMYNYLGNLLFISFLMLCSPMVAIMLFVEN